jgi:hypothetical protein
MARNRNFDRNFSGISNLDDQYMEDCLIHLRNTTCYQQLSEAKVMEAVAILEEELKLN